MKWITTDYKGDKKVWYSDDVIEKIRNICYEGIYAGMDYDILDILDEVDK
jgi:hypothetical protein